MKNDNPDVAIDMTDDEYTPLISAKKSTKNNVTLALERIKLCQQIVNELNRIQTKPYLTFGSKVTLSLLICGGLISSIAVALAPMLESISLDRANYLIESEEAYQFIYSNASIMYGSRQCATRVDNFSNWPGLCHWNSLNPDDLSLYGQWVNPCNGFLSTVCQTNRHYNHRFRVTITGEVALFIMLISLEFYLLFYLTYQWLQNHHQFDAINYLLNNRQLSALQHKLAIINMTIPQGISCSELIKKLGEKKEILINDHTIKWPRRLAFLAGMLDSSANTPLHDVYFNAFKPSYSQNRFFHSPEITKKIFDYAELLPTVRHSPVA